MVGPAVDQVEVTSVIARRPTAVLPDSVRSLTLVEDMEVNDTGYLWDHDFIVDDERRCYLQPTGVVLAEPNPHVPMIRVTRAAEGYIAVLPPTYRFMSTNTRKRRDRAIGLHAQEQYYTQATGNLLTVWQVLHGVTS